MSFRILLKAFKPIRLISLVMTYLLGAGLVQYVREMKSWTVFIQGGVFLLLFYLTLEYLRLLQTLADPQYWPDGLKENEAKQIRLLIAIITATFLTVVTTIMISWLHSGILWQGLVFLLSGLIILGGIYYLCIVIASLRQFEILIEILFFIVIPPALAYFLQSDNPHNLLTMVVIALVPAFLANRLLSLLQSYAIDRKLGLESIVVQIGWENAMVYHNALILLSYFIYALMALLGFPWFLMWPVFLTLPIGLLQIWLMERVKRGMKPLWKVMRFAVACVLFIPIYLLGFAFWIR